MRRHAHLSTLGPHTEAHAQTHTHVLVHTDTRACRHTCTHTQSHTEASSHCHKFPWQALNRTVITCLCVCLPISWAARDSGDPVQSVSPRASPAPGCQRGLAE